jgi:outer membrane protein assembly factor BamB
MHIRPILAILILPFLLLPLALAGDNWPEFRGPHGDGHADAHGLPVRWSETENVRWKTAIHGKGWASPVLWGDQVWLATAPADGTKLQALCVHRDTGEVLHDLEIFDNPRPAFCIDFNSYASSTPAIEEGRIYLHYGSAGTACVATTSGKILWTRRDLPCNHFRGPGSSVVLHGDRLVLTFDGFDSQYLVALDKRTGKTLWKTDRRLDYTTTNGDLKKAYSTPTIIKVDGRELVISPSAQATQAFDLASGEEIWRVNHEGMNSSCRPLYAHGHLFVTTGHNNKLLALRADGKGDLTASNIDWKYTATVPTRSSPLLIDDLIYTVTDNGIAGCVEARTGNKVWRERLGGAFSASPIDADGRIYFFNQEGLGFVLAPGRKFELLAANKLSQGCMASPAAVGTALFVRTRTHLYRIEQK